jgi:hypothetical protein
MRAQVALALAIFVVACEAPVAELTSRDIKSKAAATSRPPERPKPAAAKAPAAVENTTAGATVDDTSTEPVPCAAAEFHYPVVKAACADGGRNAVKKIMRGVIAQAKRAGTELKCASCHLDQTTFGLRPNAVDDISHWL